MDSINVITVLFATSVQNERSCFSDLVEINRLSYRVLFPENIQEADRLLESEAVDLIITDSSFAGGAFLDWLSLWPRPFIVLAYYGEEKYIDTIIQDEACSFIMRDADNRHLGSLPTMIRKVLNIRESLNRQNAHVQISERRYLELVSAIPDIVYTLDGNGCIIYINDAVSQIGYTAVELIGKHFSILLHEEDISRVSRHHVLKQLSGKITGPEFAPKLFDERRSGSRMTRNLIVRLNPKPDSISDEYRANVHSYGEISCVGIPLGEYEDNLIGTVGIIRDVTQRKNEEMILKKDLENKEILLKEIHHRVKNNLQVISSLLNLRSSDIDDSSSRAVFHESELFIQSISMVHEQLYQSDDLVSINMKGFIHSLVSFLMRSYGINSDRMTIVINCMLIQICIDQAIPLALIITELLSHSLKYGFARSGGALELTMFFNPDKALRFEYSDNGSGFPEKHSVEELQKSGQQLIEALSQQLDGTFSYQSKENSLSAILEFPYVKPDCMDDFLT